MIDEVNYNERDEDEDKYQSSNDIPQRYWSSHRPTRENSTTYWSKSNDRIKKSNANVEVGPRYYSTGDQLRRERQDRGEKQVDEDKRIDEKEKNTPGENVEEKKAAPTRNKNLDLLTSRTGGAYIPPARLKMMQESITDKGR